MFLWDVLIILLCVVCIGKGDILRLDACNKLYANFNVVFENTLLTNTVYSLVENILLNRCLEICMHYPKCKSLSYMIHHSQCRIHHSTSADNETILQDVIGWVHYEATENKQNLGPVCYEKKPCKYGRCVDTCDVKGYKCQCEEKWILLKRDVCFETHANQFGTFHIPEDGIITAIKLVHVGGSGVTCGPEPRTYWGCDANTNYDNKDSVGVAITDDENNILYPDCKFHIKHGYYYNLSGFNAYSPYLVFNTSNHFIYKGQVLRLHYAETLLGAYLDNNKGESCANIYAIKCDK